MSFARRAAAALAGAFVCLGLMTPAGAGSEQRTGTTGTLWESALDSLERGLDMPEGLRPPAGVGAGPDFFMFLGPQKVTRKGKEYKVQVSLSKYGTGKVSTRISFTRNTRSGQKRSFQQHGWVFPVPRKALNVKGFPQAKVNTGKALGGFGKIKMAFEASKSKKSCGGKVTKVRGKAHGKLVFKSKNKFFGKLAVSSLRARLFRDRGCSSGTPQPVCPTPEDSIEASENLVNMVQAVGAFSLEDRAVLLAARYAVKSFAKGMFAHISQAASLLPRPALSLSDSLTVGMITGSKGSLFSGIGNYIGVADPPDPPESCGGKDYSYQESQGTLTGNLKARLDGFPDITIPPGGLQASAQRTKEV